MSLDGLVTHEGVGKGGTRARDSGGYDGIDDIQIYTPINRYDRYPVFAMKKFYFVSAFAFAPEYWRVIIVVLFDQRVVCV